MKKKLFSILIICLAIISTSSYSFAHSGKTDYYGGHNDKKNKSGLGEYHYCNGYPAHLHTKGTCPYKHSNSSLNSSTYSSPPKSVYTKGSL